MGPYDWLGGAEMARSFEIIGRRLVVMLSNKRSESHKLVINSIEINSILLRRLRDFDVIDSMINRKLGLIVDRLRPRSANGRI